VALLLLAACAAGEVPKRQQPTLNTGMIESSRGNDCVGLSRVCSPDRRRLVHHSAARRIIGRSGKSKANESSGTTKRRHAGSSGSNAHPEIYTESPRSAARSWANYERRHEAEVLGRCPKGSGRCPKCSGRGVTMITKHSWTGTYLAKDCKCPGRGSVTGLGCPSDARCKLCTCSLCKGDGKTVSLNVGDMVSNF